MALKSVEPGQIISLTVESLKWKTVLSAQRVDYTKNEIFDKVTWNTFLISRFLPWQDTSSYGLAALRLFEFIWPLFPQNWGTILTFSKSGFWRSNMISGSQFQSWRNKVHFKILIYSRNLKTKNVFQINLWEIWISALSTFWAYKTVFDFKFSTMG